MARRIATLYRELGGTDGTLYLFNSALSWATGGWARLHKYRFVAQPVVAEPWLPARRGLAIEVRELAESDPLLRELPRPPGTIPHRSGQGAVCLAAFTKGRCAGFLWMVLGPYREDDGTCRYVPLPQGKACWDFDLYIYPEHRGSLVFLRLWDEANRYLAARGVRWSLSRISAFNADSMAAHARMGASCIGSVTFLFLGSLQCSVSTVAPRFFVSPQRRQVPSFVLDSRTSCRT